MSLWNDVLERIERQMSRPSFETWIKSSRLKSIDEESNTAIVETNNEFARDWLETRYASLIRETLFEVTGKEYTLQFVVENGQKPPAQIDSTELLLQLTRQVSELTSEVSNLRTEMKELRDALEARFGTE